MIDSNVKILYINSDFRNMEISLKMEMKRIKAVVGGKITYKLYLTNLLNKYKS